MSSEQDVGAKPRVAVMLPSALVALFPGAVPRLDIESATVGEVMDALDARWPGMRDRLCDARPAIRRHINVFVDGERANLETTLRDGTEVVVLTAISGG